MNITDLKNPIDPQEVGQEMYDLIKELYPICRSITGNGVRETLRILQRYIPLDIKEIPTGTKVFDWEVPKEWNIRDAWIKNARGERVVDFRKSNLHVVSYSLPVKARMTLDELKPHLHTLPDFPDWIPYRTSYYNESWGFCLSHNQLMALDENEYEVCIDSSLEPGFLTYGEYYLQGEIQEEILLSAHVCHPSLANDNLSGVSLATMLAKQLDKVTQRYSYRFLFIPGTIGAITWLSLNEEKTKKIRNGLVIAGIGDPGNITYKRSRRGDLEIDKAACHILKHSGKPHQVLDFSPYGYDERQYCSPGFNLPVGRLSRTPYGEYAEYHTSADNLDFVTPDSLADSFSIMMEVFTVLENNQTVVNLNPKCEPQLGKRDLYSSIGSNKMALLWVLNLADGENSLLEIAERSGLDFSLVARAAKALVEKGLLALADGQ